MYKSEFRTRNSSILIAFSDIVSALKSYSLVGMLGWQDIRRRYRRSGLGPFWVTLSVGVMISTIGIVFGEIFKSPMSEFLPFLTVGMILWSFIASVINDGCTSFIVAEGIIKQLPMPMFVHTLRMLWRNILIFTHSIMIFPLVLLAVDKPLSWIALVSIPGFLLTAINMTWIALILGVSCARYRDLPEIVGSILQIFFYLTPIMWMPHLLPARAGIYLLDLNPVYHLLEIVRSPLLGKLPTMTNWTVSVSMALAGWVLALIIFGHYKRRIVFWL